MACEQSEDLGIRYLVALDLVRRAQQRVYHAVTLTNIECANTELRRVDEYRLDMLRELAAHCERHGCATPELMELFRREQIGGTMAGAA